MNMKSLESRPRYRSFVRSYVTRILSRHDSIPVSFRASTGGIMKPRSRSRIRILQRSWPHFLMPNINSQRARKTPPANGNSQDVKLKAIIGDTEYNFLLQLHGGGVCAGGAGGG